MIIFFYVVDEKWKLLDNSQLKFIMYGLENDISISMVFRRHEQVLMSMQAEGKDVIQIFLFDILKKKLGIIDWVFLLSQILFKRLLIYLLISVVINIHHLILLVSYS